MEHFCLCAIIFLCLEGIYAKASGSFTDSFSHYNSSLWEQGDSKMHCDDICFMALPDHLEYNTADTDNTSTNVGLVSTLNDIPCKDDPSKCDNAAYASGHLSSVDTYLYGHFEWYSSRIGHGDKSHPKGPTNEFTCFSCYIGSPVHNEIAMCIDYDSNQLHCAYWYDSTMHRNIVTLDGSVILAESYHNFHFKWTNNTVEYFLDDKTMWKVTSNDPKKVPYEPCNIKIILRPTGSNTYQEPAYLFVDEFSYQTL